MKFLEDFMRWNRVTKGRMGIFWARYGTLIFVVGILFSAVIGPLPIGPVLIASGLLSASALYIFAHPTRGLLFVACSAFAVLMLDLLLVKAGSIFTGFYLLTLCLSALEGGAFYLLVKETEAEETTP